jgi:hypothetical protein
MELSANDIQNNWDKILDIIDIFPEPRKETLRKLYTKFQERIMFSPASYKKEYHNAFPGGYADHIIRVTQCASELHKVWEQMGVNTSTYTYEELIFSALNHDIGKLGDDEHESYIPQTDTWRKDKLGEDYMFNNKLAFASVPDRGLYLLQLNDVKYSFNEMVAIQTHDGLYDESNKKYLTGFSPEQKPRTALPYIIHQADMMATRIEFEREWLGKVGETKKPETKKTTPAQNKTKALSTIKSPGLQNMLNNL